jgi:biotin carboxyl carrier protein
MKLTAIIDGERVEIEVNASKGGGIHAQIGGRQYVLDGSAVEPGVYWFNWENRSIEVSVVANADGYCVSVNGQSLSVEIVDARSLLRKATQRGYAGKIELRAPMPGRVVKVLVTEGIAVEANQGIVVIEAMKMQNEIKTPKKGIVKRLSVQEAAAVNAGDLLAIVE